ncbi:YbjN domain-containing protein [Moraxella sp.]|uniref:YbjN domain-containing protein n=1 Tax=Moraxella sp. TaxID=479 RepID=UPI0026DB1E19|nr:YbjN domain-containing protein [Moraxella sp.]MDO4894024.1 YbjN domain-containing protein [Moraxella sp.]
MNFFKRLKQRLTKSNRSNSAQTDETTAQISHRQSLIKTITAWLSDKDWHYEQHNNPNLPHTWHFILHFQEFKDWACVLQVNEQNQLVNLYGVLTQTVPETHFAAALVAINRINTRLPLGNIELDTSDGELRVRIGFDAEFVPPTNKLLDMYLHLVIQLSKAAHELYGDLCQEEEPSPIIYDYLMNEPNDDEVESSPFFEPTQQYQ